MSVHVLLISDDRLVTRNLEDNCIQNFHLGGMSSVRKSEI